MEKRRKRIEGKDGLIIDIEKSKYREDYSIVIPYIGDLEVLQRERCNPKGFCILDNEKFAKEQGFSNVDELFNKAKEVKPNSSQQ